MLFYQKYDFYPEVVEVIIFCWCFDVWSLWFANGNMNYNCSLVSPCPAIETELFIWNVSKERNI